VQFFVEHQGGPVAAIAIGHARPAHGGESSGGFARCRAGWG
jgi:hypothetical protein